MFDVNFYMKSYPIVKRIESGEKISREELYSMFERIRSKDPVIYNIETTNDCNMRCRMCPRTTRMTREISHLEPELVSDIISQIKPHDPELWKEWEAFCTSAYGIAPNSEPGENHFFLHVIPKVIQLHGYGDPLLDKNLGNVVKILSLNGFESYFSCNPANININKTVEMMDLGLNYLKYSFESTDDAKFKDIRGDRSNFTESYNKTIELLNIKEKNNYKTRIIITMINVGHDDEQQQEFHRLRKSFEDLDVYVYLKSEDQQWYRKDETLVRYLSERNRQIPDQSKSFFGTQSIHWLEFCKHPWMSMTIKSDGEVHMCMEDYNNEVYLGNTRKERLYDIWNGKLYDEFRWSHLYSKPGIKCSERCDMKEIGDYFQG